MTEESSLFSENLSLVPFVFYKHFSPHFEQREILLEEGLIALWKACLSYDESTGFSFSTYACSKIFFGIKNYLNRQEEVRIQEVSLDYAIGEDTDNKVCLNDMLYAEEDHSTKYMIEACLNKMTDTEKKIVELLMYGYSQKESARAAGVSQPTASRCLRKFKKLFEKEKRL